MTAPYSLQHAPARGFGRRTLSPRRGRSCAIVDRCASGRAGSYSVSAAARKPNGLPGTSRRSSCPGTRPSSSASASRATATSSSRAVNARSAPTCAGTDHRVGPDSELRGCSEARRSQRDVWYHTDADEQLRVARLRAAEHELLVPAATAAPERGPRLEAHDVGLPGVVKRDVVDAAHGDSRGDERALVARAEGERRVAVDVLDLRRRRRRGGAATCTRPSFERNQTKGSRGEIVERARFRGKIKARAAAPPRRGLVRR